MNADFADERRCCKRSNASGVLLFERLRSLGARNRSLVASLLGMTTARTLQPGHAIGHLLADCGWRLIASFRREKYNPTRLHHLPTPHRDHATPTSSHYRGFVACRRLHQRCSGPNPRRLDALSGNGMAHDRAESRRTIDCRGGERKPATRVLLRRDRRRPLEDHGWRSELAPSN